MFSLREYQQKTVEDAISFLTNAKNGERRLYVSPCGTGKSLIEIAIQRAVPNSVILSPRTEIIDGMIEKGADCDRVFTPITYRNRLLRGEVQVPTAIIADEGHHDTCSTADIIRLCVGSTPVVAFTATPFRGTPQGTAALRTLYGEPRYVLTLRDAVERGLCVLPKCTTRPILDDDIVEIANGEFKRKTVETKTPWAAACDLLCELWARPVPTVVAMPGVQSLRSLGERLTLRGMPWRGVTQETTVAERRDAFRSCVAAETMMLQIQVVSEGVDLHVRRLVDLAPTTSPVRWLQQVGRAMRPGPGAEYIACNRNLLRHGYLLEGLLPVESIVQGQLAFPNLPKRDGIRAFGLEGLGKLRPCRVPLANGSSASAYYVTQAKEHVATQYVAIVLPQSPEVLWATRKNWDAWQQCQAPVELMGFTSVPPRPLTIKQANWWKGAAKRYGLDPEAEVDAKVFGVLPVLHDLGVKVC